MVDGADHRLQAAHLLIGELMSARLDLLTQLVGIEEQRKVAEARAATAEARLAALDSAARAAGADEVME